MMKKIALLFTILFVFSFFSLGSVTVRVCGPDENTHYFPQKIMKGQELTFIVSVDPNDPNDYWSGAFFIEGDDRSIGSLTARDSDPNLRDYTDSHFPEAGDNAIVFAWDDSEKFGFDLYSSDSNCISGDWFIVDYKAVNQGVCSVNFYDYDSSWTEPNLVFTFEQDPSCDFNDDGYVNMNDFNQISSYWHAYCNYVNDPNSCFAVDLDNDSIVDVNDLMIFVRHWLWDGSIREAEVVFVPTPDPNLIYSVVDPYGMDEITINTGESIRLYVDLQTFGESEITSFDIEVHISDPNLGSIDNTPDPNGTAEILATPRYQAFDMWGPGHIQQEGIHLAAFNLAFDPNDPPISDGNIASFVYTAGLSGDIELSILDILSKNRLNESIYPTVKSIVIHQVDQQMSSVEMSSAMMSEPMETSITEQSVEKQFTADEAVSLLEQIYTDDEEFQNSVDPQEWQDFLDDVRESYDNTY